MQTQHEMTHQLEQEETLRTCYNPHCSSMGPGICSGHGTVRVKHYSSAASESAQGMPWEGGLGLAGLVQLHGRGILSEQGSSAAAFLSSWTMEGSLWHVVLDNIAGFWEMLHKHYAVDDLQVCVSLALLLHCSADFVSLVLCFIT